MGNFSCLLEVDVIFSSLRKSSAKPKWKCISLINNDTESSVVVLCVSKLIVEVPLRNNNFPNMNYF